MQIAIVDATQVVHCVDTDLRQEAADHGVHRLAVEVVGFPGRHGHFEQMALHVRIEVQLLLPVA